VQGVGEPNSTLTGEKKKRPDCLGRYRQLPAGSKGLPGGEGGSHNRLKSKEQSVSMKQEKESSMCERPKACHRGY
jgi:hypothetical protein